jgi:opacity protein-like surface antigen
VNIMRKLIFATAALALSSAALGAQAQTADKGWTGPYVGAQAGWGWRAGHGHDAMGVDSNLDGTFNDTVANGSGGNLFSPGFCRGTARGSTPAAGCHEDNGGFEFGGRAGYDWQLNHFVVGLVGEASRTDVGDSMSAFSTTPDSYTFSRNLKGVLAARARAGYAFGGNLLYATGGYAAGRIQHAFSTTNVDNTATIQQGDKWANGWQLGGGIEHKVTPNLSLGLEYLYTKLDDKDFTARIAGPASAGNPFLVANAAGVDLRDGDKDLKTQAVRMTASYRF